jgi:hypothetical protein
MFLFQRKVYIFLQGAALTAAPPDPPVVLRGVSKGEERSGSEKPERGYVGGPIGGLILPESVLISSRPSQSRRRDSG